MNKKIVDIEKSIELLEANKRDIIKAADDKAKAEKAEAAKRSRAEIDDMVAMYNQQDTEQTQRLARIFYLIKQRHGYRRVNFSNDDQWSNCWGNSDRLDKMPTRQIIEVIPGE